MISLLLRVTSSSSRNGLQRHEKSYHDSMTYPCDQCELSLKTYLRLKQHIAKVHDGLRFPSVVLAVMKY